MFSLGAAVLLGGAILNLSGFSTLAVENAEQSFQYRDRRRSGVGANEGGLLTGGGVGQKRQNFVCAVPIT
jgi:hypothetical protein